MKLCWSLGGCNSSPKKQTALSDWQTEDHACVISVLQYSLQMAEVHWVHTWTDYPVRLGWTGETGRTQEQAAFFEVMRAKESWSLSPRHFMVSMSMMSPHCKLRNLRWEPTIECRCMIIDREVRLKQLHCEVQKSRINMRNLHKVQIHNQRQRGKDQSRYFRLMPLLCEFLKQRWIISRRNRLVIKEEKHRSAIGAG